MAMRESAARGARSMRTPEDGAALMFDSEDEAAAPRFSAGDKFRSAPAKADPKRTRTQAGADFMFDSDDETAAPRFSSGDKAHQIIILFTFFFFLRGGCWQRMSPKTFPAEHVLTCIMHMLRSKNYLP